MAEFETRYLAMPQSEVRLQQVDEQRRLGGYAAVFDVMSEELITPQGMRFRESIKPGAFKRAVRKTADVRALINHDPSQVLGRTKSGTLRLEEDAVGLRADIDLPDTTPGRDIQVSVNRGDIDGMSFRFKVDKDDWQSTEEGEVRTIFSVEVVDEVTVATFPAFTDTSVAVRSHQAWQETNKEPEPEPEKGPLYGIRRKRLRLAEADM